MSSALSIAQVEDPLPLVGCEWDQLTFKVLMAPVWLDWQWFPCITHAVKCIVYITNGRRYQNHKELSPSLLSRKSITMIATCR